MTSWGSGGMLVGGDFLHRPYCLSYHISREYIGGIGNMLGVLGHMYRGYRDYIATVREECYVWTGLLKAARRFVLWLRNQFL